MKCHAFHRYETARLSSVCTGFSPGPDEASESSQPEIITDENWAVSEMFDAVSSVPERRTLCERTVFPSQPPSLSHRR